MPISPLRIETLSGQPVMVEDMQVYVRSQVVQLWLPNANGGLIWNRPVSVVVRRPDGQEQALSVPDVTRLTVLALLVFSYVGTVLMVLFRREKAES